MTVRSLWPMALAAALVTLGLGACEGCRSSGAPGATANAGNLDAGAPTLRLYLLTDLAGALEPCGCTKDQLGGLDHFGAWVTSDRARDSGPAWVAAAGPLFFMDETLQGDRADQDRIKAETIARVLRGLDLVAFAPGVNDWADGVAGLTKLAALSGGVPIVGGGPDTPPFARVTVREAQGVKVGFVGFGQGPPGAGASDVEEEVERGVQAAKGEGASVLVALGAVGRGEAKRIADAVPELAAVVVGSVGSSGEANTEAPQPERVGDVLVVEAANHLQSVAVLDLYVRDAVSPGRPLKFADATGLERSQKRREVARQIDELHVRIAAWERDPKVAPADVQARKRELSALERERAALDVAPAPVRGSFFRYSVQEVRPSLGEDPAIQAQLASYYKAVDAHNRAAFADRLPPPHGPDQAFYVGVDACARCHAPAVAVWRGTAHAQAYATLASQYKEFNLECVSCHVTGYERPGGSTVTHVDGLRDVQCEVCHGPGSKHVRSPLDEGAIIADPEPAGCLSCHHPPHVEGFDPAVKMKEILGPGHGLPRAGRAP